MIGRATVVGSINHLLGATLGLVTLHFVTTYAMAPQSYIGARVLGEWVYATALLAPLAVLTGLGFHQAHVRRLSQGQGEGRANGAFLLIKLGLTLAFAVAAAVAFEVVTRYLGKQPTDVDFTVLLFALVFHAIVSLRGFFDFSFQGRGLFVVYESVMLVDTLFTLAGVMSMALAIGHANGVPVPLAGWAAMVTSWLAMEGPMDTFSAAGYLALGYVGGKVASLVYASVQFLRHRFDVRLPDGATFRQYRSFALPLAIVGVLAVLTQNIDRIFLGHFHTNLEVGAFEVAFKLVTPALGIATMVGAILFSVISRMEARGEREPLRAALAETERYLSIFLFGTMAVTIVLADEAVHWLTQGQVPPDTAKILVALVPFLYFSSLFVVPRAALLGHDRTKSLMRVGLVNVTLLLSLNFVAIPNDIRSLGLPLLGWKGFGAALVASFAAFASYVYMRWQGRAWMTTHWLPIGTFRHLASATGAALLLNVVVDDVFPPVLRLGHLLLSGVLGGLVYVAFLFLFRAATMKDVKGLLALMHPSRFAGYVGGELTARPPPTGPPPEPPFKPVK